MERRDGPRWPATAEPAQVAWIECNRVRTTAAIIVDVSRSGLLVLTDAAPAKLEHPLVIRLSRILPLVWVRTRLVEERQFRSGPFQLRLAFHGRCPGTFLAAAAAPSSGDWN